MSPMPQMAKARTRNPTTPPMMPLPSAEEEALRRPRSMATGSWLEGAEEKPVRKVAHNRDRPEPSQLKGLRPFARAAGLLAQQARNHEVTMATTRRPLVAGNWKMNGLKSSAAEVEKLV